MVVDYFTFLATKHFIISCMLLFNLQTFYIDFSQHIRYTKAKTNTAYFLSSYVFCLYLHLEKLKLIVYQTFLYFFQI